MNTLAPIFIPINRRKMILMTIIYGLMGIISLLVVYYLGAYQQWVSHTVFKVASVIVLLFFAVVAGTFAKNIKNQDAGLKIHGKGIEDLTSSISGGLIPWKEITALIPMKSASANYLLVEVRHPQKIINAAKNGAVKRVLQQNMRIYKTPLVINVGVLTKSLAEVEQDANRFFERFGTKK